MQAKDVVHLYFGQRFLIEENNDVKVIKKLEAIDSLTIKMAERGWIRPILRPLSSMTNEEARDMWHIAGGSPGVTNPMCALTDYTFHANWPIDKWAIVFPLLLSKGFDVFNLHASGECLYEQDLNKPELN